MGAVGQHFAEVRDEVLQRERLVGNRKRHGLPDCLLALTPADRQIGKLDEELRPEPDDRVGELAAALRAPVEISEGRRSGAPVAGRMVARSGAGRRHRSRPAA